MKFAVIGGDRRSAWLCALLEGDGHRVYTYALEKAELPKEVPKAGCLPVLAAPGLPGVYAPYTAAELMRETIYTVISEGDE